MLYTVSTFTSGTEVWLVVVFALYGLNLQDGYSGLADLLGPSCPCPSDTLPRFAWSHVHDGTVVQIIVPLIRVVSTCTSGTMVPLIVAFACTPSSLLG